MSTIDPVLLQAVSASRLAEDLTPPQIPTLAAVLRLQSFAAGEVLARAGTRDNHLYAVVDGSLAVVKQLGAADQEVLAVLKPGDFAHELGFLDGSERYASLVAETDARALVLELDALERLVDANPRVLYAVMRAIVRSAHRTQTRMAMQASELTNYIVKQHGRY
jgi:CRP/FNR family cyclic AMP-dependent transcriptional regulator